MPGFFEGLKRLANGEPVFREDDSSRGWADASGRKNPGEPSIAQPNASPSAEKKSGVVKGQPSTFPVVVVKRTRTQLSGNNQMVYCSIVNSSNGPVELEEMHLMGHSRNLGGYLRPNEEREYMVYSGSRQDHEDHQEAYLNYKDESGDYFQSVYDVEYQYESDKTYSVEELHLRMPIRDIYG